jgi:hypothetical protein
MNKKKMISDLKNKLKMSDEEIKDITGGSLLGLEDFYSQMKTSGAFEKPIKKKAMGGDLKTEYRAGGAVNLGNYKGQF